MARIAMVEEIANGYIVTNLKEGTRFYVEKFDISVIIDTAADTAARHAAALRDLVQSFSSDGGKIPAIKAVRAYCSSHGFDKYYGLSDAKDYVESVRDDFKPHYFR